MDASSSNPVVVTINGRSAQQAKGEVAYVPQRGAVDWDFPITVREVALMGRYGKIPWWRDPGREDRAAASEALSRRKSRRFMASLPVLAGFHMRQRRLFRSFQIIYVSNGTSFRIQAGRRHTIVRAAGPN